MLLAHSFLIFFRFNQKRPEYASQQYNEDYDNAQDYSQPSHNYAKRLSELCTHLKRTR